MERGWHSKYALPLLLYLKNFPWRTIHAGSPGSFFTARHISTWFDPSILIFSFTDSAVLTLFSEVFVDVLSSTVESLFLELFSFADIVLKL